MSDTVTFWNGHPLASLSEELYHKLVPPEGNAPTLQGELIRASMKINWDWYNNGWGCNNWSGAVVFLRKHINDLVNRIDGTSLAKLTHELNYAYEFSHGEPAPRNDERADTCVTTIHEIVIDAILKNPDPIANIRDMYDYTERSYREPEDEDDWRHY